MLYVTSRCDLMWCDLWGNRFKVYRYSTQQYIQYTILLPLYYAASYFTTLKLLYWQNNYHWYLSLLLTYTILQLLQYGDPVHTVKQVRDRSSGRGRTVAVHPAESVAVQRPELPSRLSAPAAAAVFWQGSGPALHIILGNPGQDLYVYILCAYM